MMVGAVCTGFPKPLKRYAVGNRVANHVEYLSGGKFGLRLVDNHQSSVLPNMESRSSIGRAG